jgi:hypothetical protein
MASDTFTNISASAVATRTSGFEFLSYSTTGANAYVAVPTSTPNGFTLTGTGTLADPFIFPPPLSVGSASVIHVRALRSGTFYFSGGVANNNDDNESEFRMQQLRITGSPNDNRHWGIQSYDTAITGTTQDQVRITEGVSGTRSFTIVKNRVYRTWQTGGYAGHDITNLRFWAT